MTSELPFVGFPGPRAIVAVHFFARKARLLHPPPPPGRKPKNSRFCSRREISVTLVANPTLFSLGRQEACPGGAATATAELDSSRYYCCRDANSRARILLPTRFHEPSSAICVRKKEPVKKSIIRLRELSAELE